MATAASRWQPPRPLPPPPGRGVAAQDPREGVGRARLPDPRPGVCPRGSAGPGGGVALRPLPTPTRRPWDWERKGEVRPRPRTAPSGLEAVLEGGGIRGGGNAIAFPHPKHGRRPPPAGGGGGFRIGGAQPGRPTEEAFPMPDPGDPKPPPPGLAPEEVTHLHGPSPGAAPPPNLPPSPALGRRGFHAGRDSPPKATSNTRTLMGGERAVQRSTLPGLLLWRLRPSPSPAHRTCPPP